VKTDESQAGVFTARHTSDRSGCGNYYGLETTKTESHALEPTWSSRLKPESQSAFGNHQQVLIVEHPEVIAAWNSIVQPPCKYATSWYDRYK
jgi:hypothetical protein